MGTHCQTAVQSGSGERQNLGAVTSFLGQKKGDDQLQTENSSFVFPLFYGIHSILYKERCVEDFGSLL